MYNVQSLSQGMHQYAQTSINSNDFIYIFLQKGIKQSYQLSPGLCHDLKHVLDIPSCLQIEPFLSYNM